MIARQGSDSLLDIGRRVNRIGLKYRVIEASQSAMLEGSAQYGIAQVQLVNLLSDQVALEELALAARAETLTDAAVQLCILYDTLTEVSLCELDSQLRATSLARDLEKFRHALGGITLVVANAAGLTLEEVGEPDLVTRLEQA